VSYATTQKVEHQHPPADRLDASEHRRERHRDAERDAMPRKAPGSAKKRLKNG
jgi:hypothetical protein